MEGGRDGKKKMFDIKKYRNRKEKRKGKKMEFRDPSMGS